MKKGLPHIGIKILIEIIIAGALLVGEVIWALCYRFSGFIVNLYSYDNGVGYGGLYMSKLIAIFVDVDVLYAIVVLLINSKSEKNKKIFEIFVAVLLFVAQTIAVLYCRIVLADVYMAVQIYFVRLLVVFIQINMLYIIALLIINSWTCKLWKTVIAAALVMIAFVITWLWLTNMTVKVDGDNAFVIILTVLSSIYTLYAVGLIVFDFICKLLKNKKDSAAETAQTSD